MEGTQGAQGGNGGRQKGKGREIEDRTGIDEGEGGGGRKSGR